MRDASFQPFLSWEPRSKSNSRVVSQHTKPKTLRSSVAIDERVTRIDLVNVSCRRLREVLFSSANQIAITRELFE
jgi:hypothetical protein